MISFHESNLIDLALHQVGNQTKDELLVLGKGKLHYSQDVEKDLLTYFLSSFKSNEYFHFYHETDIEMNEVYKYVSAIFDDPESLQAPSENLAKHLFENSSHPNIKGGEFYVAYLTECMFDGELVDGVGLFKSETKDTFLNIRSGQNGFEIQSNQGININKLDKGCFIFNTEKEDGYVCAVVDQTNKGNDAKYWLDHFLKVEQRQDEYFQTQNAIKLAKSFISKELPEQFDADTLDQADLMNRSVKYFKEQEEFNIDEFANTVIAQPDIIDSFNVYKTDYQNDRAIEIKDDFRINDSAVKKTSNVFKSVIKLDKNFHIYVHGNRDKIEKGIDEMGRKYYICYYENES